MNEEKNCRYCKKSIPYNANVCFQCGLPQNRFLRYAEPIAFIGLLVSVGFFILSIWSSFSSNKILQETKTLTVDIASVHVENVLSRGRLSRISPPEELEAERNKLLEMLSRANIDKETINKVLEPLTKTIEYDLKRELYNQSHAIFIEKALDKESEKALWDIIFDYDRTSSKSKLIDLLKEKNAYKPDLDLLIEKLDNFIRKDSLLKN